MAVDLVVVHTPVGGGHRSAALAVAEAARARGLRAVVLDTFEHAPLLFGQAYLTAHLTAQGTLPELYGSLYFGSNRKGGALEPMRRGIDHFAWAGLVKRVVALAPRAVVATHHLPLVVLGRARRKGRLLAPLVGVVTDYATHAVWAEKGVDALCVPCVGAFRDAAAHGFPVDQMRLTGIPVHAGFEAISPVRDPASDEPLRVLLTSGGFGVGPVRAVVQSFAGVPSVELTVVCGRAERLVRQVHAALARAAVPAVVIGFERDMAARVAAAHLVVGKAGGLTVSEALTAGRAMVVAGAVPGNETINAQMLCAGGAGVVARPRDVGQVVHALRESGAIGAMGRRAGALLVHGAAGRVVDVAMQAIPLGSSEARYDRSCDPSSPRLDASRGQHGSGRLQKRAMSSAGRRPT